MWQPITRTDVPITQQFGVNPLDYRRYGLPGHNGLDFGVPTGTQLYAPADGVIVELSFDVGGYGLYIKLRCAQADWLYAHLSDTGSTAPGDEVVAATPIARSGNTGNSTGPHVHVGYRPLFTLRETPYFGYVDPQPELEILAQADSVPF